MRANGMGNEGETATKKKGFRHNSTGAKTMGDDISTVQQRGWEKFIDTLFLPTTTHQGQPYVIFWSPVVGQQGQTFRKHWTAQTAEQAKAKLRTVYSYAGEAHVCLGTALQPYQDVPSRADPSKTERKYRTESMLTEGVMSVSMDLDVDPIKIGCYANINDAALFIQTWVTRLNWPVPALVSTGNGIHAHWIFTEMVPPATYKAFIDTVHQVAARMGGKLDTAKKSITSTFRVPGSTNTKNDEVKIAEVLDTKYGTYPFEELELKLHNVASEMGVVFHTRQITHLLNIPKNEFTTFKDSPGGVEGPEVDLMLVAENCPQMKYYLQSKGNVQEPFWYAGLGVITFCQNGEELALEYSSGHPTFDSEETQKKIEQWRTAVTGPSSCALLRDRSEQPDLCNGCIFNGKITTPIQAGRGVHVIPPDPEDTVSQPTDNPASDLPQKVAPSVVLPKGFFLREGRLNFASFNLETGSTEELVIYEHPLVPVRLAWDEMGCKEMAYFKVTLPGKRKRDITLSVGDIYDQRTLLKTIGNAGVVPPPGMMKLLCQYIIECVRTLQSEPQLTRRINAMGWREHGGSFTLGDKTISSDGVHKEMVAEGLAPYVRFYKSKGQVASWAKAANVYDQEEYYPFAAAVLMGIAAPLVSMSPHSGYVYNLYGNSGSGKSTALKVAASVYGTPTEGMLLARDTEKAKYMAMGVLKHLPVTFDEVTNTHPAALSDFCYSVTQGRAHQRLTRASTLMTHDWFWATTVICSSNVRLAAQLSRAKANPEAEIMRLVEMRANRADMTARQLRYRDQLLSGIEDNHGVAGPLLIARMIREHPQLQTLVVERIRALQEIHPTGQQHRFWIGSWALAEIAGELAKDTVGLTYDLTAMRQWFLSHIDIMRQDVSRFVKQSIDITSELMQQVSQSLIICNGPNITHHPQGVMPLGRVDTSTGELLIAKSIVQEYANRKDTTLEETLNIIHQQGSLIDGTARPSKFWKDGMSASIAVPAYKMRVEV